MEEFESRLATLAKKGKVTRQALLFAIEDFVHWRPEDRIGNALERTCRGLYQPNDKKFYLLSGSYGTGKSHMVGS